MIFSVWPPTVTSRSQTRTWDAYQFVPPLLLSHAHLLLPRARHLLPPRALLLLSHLLPGALFRFHLILKAKKFAIQRSIRFHLIILKANKFAIQRSFLPFVSFILSHDVSLTVGSSFILARSSGFRCSCFSFLVVTDFSLFGSFPMCRKCDFQSRQMGSVLHRKGMPMPCLL